MTEKVKNIYTALLASQQEFDVINKDAKGAVSGNREYKYATLANVLDAVLPALNKNGIALLQMPVEDGEVQFVKTILHHAESGTEISCLMSLNKDGVIKGMQAVGSAITYARRYSLMALLGIAAEDDDGKAAVENQTKTKPTAKTEEPPEVRYNKAVAFIETCFDQAEFEKHKMALTALAQKLNKTGHVDMYDTLLTMLIDKETEFNVKI